MHPSVDYAELLADEAEGEACDEADDEPYNEANAFADAETVKS